MMPLPINVKTLKCYQKELVLFNLTSGTEYLDSNEIHFDEFLDDGIRLSIPKKICSSGHHLMVVICSHGEAKKIKKLSPNDPPSFAEFVGIGKVEQFVEQDSRVSIEVSFSQYSPKEWESFITELRQLQKNMDTLLDKMRAV